MAKYQFKDPLFIKSAVKQADYPILKLPSGKEMPEVAVAGRSNVGKSTLLNHLFQRRNLVKTSSVPGKTQMLNFFTVDHSLVFVDLPGYGYAKVPLQVRKHWGPMIQEYLNKRESLKVILFLFDIRRIPSDDDKKFLEWAAHSQKAVILVLTKIDKVRASEKKINTDKILKEFNSENLYHVYYSAPKDIGRKELVSVLIDALNNESES